MRERAYRYSALLFLLLAAGAVVICFRSYQTSDWLLAFRRDGNGGFTGVGIASYAGVVGVYLQRNYVAGASQPAEFGFQYNPQRLNNRMLYPLGQNVFSRFGFGYAHISDRPTALGSYFRFFQVTAPAWFVATLLLFLGVWLRRRANALRRLAQPGRCEVCGYDLRATPEAGGTLLDRCPECGHVAPQSSPRVDRIEVPA